MIAQTLSGKSSVKRGLGHCQTYEMLYKISFNIISKMTLRVRRAESSNYAPS